MHQAIFTINNTGEVPIEDVIITFHLDGFEEADFIEVVLTNPEEVQELKVQSLESDFDSFTIHLPFLNPRKKYEDYLGVTLYAPRPLTIKAVTGKGYGWATKYVDRNEYIKRVMRVVIEGATPFSPLIAKTVDLFLRF